MVAFRRWSFRVPEALQVPERMDQDLARSDFDVVLGSTVMLEAPDLMIFAPLRTTAIVRRRLGADF